MTAQGMELQLSGARKAAIFMMGIGEAASVNLMRQLDPHEIRLISAEIAGISSVAPEQMLSVFKEFESLSARGHLFALGGPERARRLLEQAVGPKDAQKLLGVTEASTPKAAAEPDGPFGRVAPSELAAALKDESPQTLALVLSNLPADQAGPLLATFTPAIQSQVALRIALMDRIAPEAFEQIADAVRRRLNASKRLQRSNGSKTLAAILNHMDGEKAETVLNTMEAENQPTAQSIRQLMFIFDDVIKINKEGIRALMSRVDRKFLTTALKGTSEAIQSHFRQCMSQRSAEMLTEDMEALGPVRIRDVQAAQQQVINTIRRLEKEGVISLSSGSGGDEYVV